ncbi:Irc21p [Kluyveromyces lactis]|uniref:KLLA0E18459p n=1 Tax=Kluyveromyces lactis (strain ATCC 8585 / CBS 2359 / DSM 70799 / NBRC 1267 / NRRL Y-1140 / WM37) TaxID=284590 RepID=Q6CMQ5_KLULA|nr:uncharacterized protein KLLA0_E18459g [Kluyveromyces lactis]CAG99871.1 KLLA0E18459p [Kluyveromyces lactis]|eukprot:XP_454784.1 uncharacterized protein KLLA0_E18459g [Kluyveromyces lactis]
MLPPRQPGCSTLAPPSGSDGPKGSGRSKVALKPGHGPLDWQQLQQDKGMKGELVYGVGSPIPPFRIQPPLRVNKEALKANKDNFWCVINRKVYCIKAYLSYHPGGEVILKQCAGKDVTSLFNKYHRWVNYERLLETCFIGMYVGSAEI